MDRTPEDLARILREQAARLLAAADELDPPNDVALVTQDSLVEHPKAWFATTAINRVYLFGSWRPVCAVCGVIGLDGLTDFLHLPDGWATAPYFDDTVHEDGSTGDLFYCPTENARSSYRHREYMASTL